MKHKTYVSKCTACISGIVRGYLLSEQIYNKNGDMKKVKLLN